MKTFTGVRRFLCVSPSWFFKSETEGIHTVKYIRSSIDTLFFKYFFVAFVRFVRQLRNMLRKVLKQKKVIIIGECYIFQMYLHWTKLLTHCINRDRLSVLVHTNHLEILLKCSLWFSSSWWGLRFCIFNLPSDSNAARSYTTLWGLVWEEINSEIPGFWRLRCQAYMSYSCYKSAEVLVRNLALHSHSGTYIRVKSTIL